MNSEQIRILFLAANPRSKAVLDLDGEYNQIEEELQRARHTEAFLLQHRWKLNRDQLLDLLVKYRPHIAHFSGHATEDNLLLEDATANVWALDRRLARDVFRAARGNVKLVVLNACYSRDVAEELSENIDCVIGMSAGLHDALAIKFSTALYRGLGNGSSVREAFDQARVQLDLSGIAGKYTPQILSMPGIDPRRLYPLRWVSSDPVPRSADDAEPVRTTRPYVTPTDRAGLRRALMQRLPTAEDFEAFVVDCFPVVAQRFSSGMDRLARTNLLMTMREPAELAAALQRYLANA